MADQFVLVEDENVSGSVEIIESLASAALEITRVNNTNYQSSDENPNEINQNSNEQRSVIVNNTDDESDAQQQQQQPIVQATTNTHFNNQQVINQASVNTVNLVEETESEDELDDYSRSRAKIPRLDLNSDVKTVNGADNDTSNVEEENCSICLEPWTNSGAHRLVCLKCGHLFGEGCIDRWIKTNPKCPQCNRSAKRSDIRRIYAKSIKVVDTAELDKALKDIESERQLRKRAEINASEMKLQYQIVNDELLSMNSKYKALLAQYHQFQQGNASSIIQSNSYSSLNSASSDKSGNYPMLFNLDKMINITEAAAGCRVVSFSNRYAALLVSQPSNNAIFPGFGIKKINFLDYKLSQYVPIHSKMIRDMALSAPNDDGIVLTCGLDKMIKLTNLSNNALVHSFECPHPIWSCCYNTDNPIYFYAGLGNGQVLMFDKRKIDKHVEVLNADFNTGSPVCSLQYVPRNLQASFSRSGLLVTQLDKLCFFESKPNDENRYHPLLVENNIMSCSFEPNTRHLIVSTRPSQKHPNVRHLIYELGVSNAANNEQQQQQQASESNCCLNLIQTHFGSNVQKMLAKTKLFYYNSELYGCAPEESTKSVVLWDVSKNETITKLSNSSEVLDICPIHFNQNNYITTLTDKQLRIFKKTE